MLVVGKVGCSFQNIYTLLSGRTIVEKFPKFLESLTNPSEVNG